MADNKKGFVLYADQKELFDQLPDELAGKLIKHIYSYVNDENPQSEDLLLKLAFTPIKQQLKRDLNKWEEEKSKRSDGGKIGNLKRWHSDLYKEYNNGKKTLEECLEIATNRSLSDTDGNQSESIGVIAVKDKVKVKVNVIDKVEDIIEKSKSTSFEPSTKSEYEKLVRWIQSDLKAVSKLDPITINQFVEACRLAGGVKQVKEKFESMENYDLKKYKSAGLTVLSWLRKK